MLYVLITGLFHCDWQLINVDIASGYYKHKHLHGT